EVGIRDRNVTGVQTCALPILAPLVRGRKGHYRELFQQLRKQGYLKVRIDGEVTDLTPKLQVDRYKIHDIELIIDRIVVEKKSRRSEERRVGKEWRSRGTYSRK